MLVCPKCKTHKNFDEFWKSSSSKSGYQSWCKQCLREKDKSWSAENKDKRRKMTKTWRENNLDYARKKGNEWRKDNLYKSAASRGKYRANKTGAIPPWLTEHHWMQIEWFYAAAQMMTKTSGMEYHVDHIHPLKGKDFNGLHVPWNLQCIPAKENRQKHKRLENVTC